MSILTDMFIEDLYEIAKRMIKKGSTIETALYDLYKINPMFKTEIIEQIYPHIFQIVLSKHNITKILIEIEDENIIDSYVKNIINGIYKYQRAKL